MVSKIRISMFFVVFLCMFLNFNSVSALSIICIPQESFFVAAYEDGHFVDGFAVEYAEIRTIGYSTGYSACGTVRPYVSDNTDRLNKDFTGISQSIKQNNSSGVYEFSSQCNGYSPEENKCSYAVKQLSSRSSDLAQFRDDWKSKENKALRDDYVRKILCALILFTVFFFVIFGLWILLYTRKNLKYIGLFFAVGIIIQFFTILLVGRGTIYNIFWPFSYSTSTYIFPIISWMSIISLVSEVVYLIVRRIRIKNLISKP